MARDKAPKVSVIISTYNRKGPLKRAIKSVLAQTMADFELIVVDDASPQDIEKTVKSFGDPRIRYYTTGTNTGHDGRPKNIGIKQARGEYVCFLDDDDHYKPEALKVLTRYADETKVHVAYADYLIGGKPGWSVDFNVARLQQHNYITMVTTIIRRECLLEVGGFDEDVPKFKDWNLWIRLQKRGYNFMHIPIVITDVEFGDDTISKRVSHDTDETGKYLPTYFSPSDCKIYPDNTILGTRKQLKVAVYTLTMNRLEYTKQMYRAMAKTAGYDFDWYVIDQGSTDGTADWLKKLSRDVRDVHRVRFGYRLYKQNVGLAKGWNNIIEFVKSEGEYDILIKIDNDAEMLTDGWLDAMVELFERNRKMVLSPYVEGLEGLPGGVLRQRASGDSPYLMLDDKVLGLVPHLGGIVYATPVELLEGWTFDESYEGNKDYLLSMYAGQRRYSLFYMEEYRVWHIDGTEGQHKKFPEYFTGRELPTNKEKIAYEQRNESGEIQGADGQSADGDQSSVSASE